MSLAGSRLPLRRAQGRRASDTVHPAETGRAARHQTPPSIVLPLVPRPTENIDAAASAKARAEEIAAERAAPTRRGPRRGDGQIAADRAAAAGEQRTAARSGPEAEKAAAEEVVARTPPTEPQKRRRKRPGLKQLAARKKVHWLLLPRNRAGEEERPAIHNLEGVQRQYEPQSALHLWRICTCLSISATKKRACSRDYRRFRRG